MYRILTERKNVDLVMKAMVRLGVDYTIFFGVGGYHLAPEKSMVIELDMIAPEIAEAAALEIGIFNDQQAVLLQEIPIKSRLISIPRAQSKPSAASWNWGACMSIIMLFRRTI